MYLEVIWPPPHIPLYMVIAIFDVVPARILHETPLEERQLEIGVLVDQVNTIFYLNVGPKYFFFII